MMQDQELVGLQREFRVGLSFIVGEFNLVGAIQELHDGADLSAPEAMHGHMRQERHDVQQARFGYGQDCSCLAEIASVMRDVYWLASGSFADKCQQPKIVGHLRFAATARRRGGVDGTRTAWRGAKRRAD